MEFYPSPNIFQKLEADVSEWKKKNLLALSIQTFVIKHSLTAATLLTERHKHTQTNIAADYMEENVNIHGSVQTVLVYKREEERQLGLII